MDSSRCLLELSGDLWSIDMQDIDNKPCVSVHVVSGAVGDKLADEEVNKLRGVVELRK